MKLAQLASAIGLVLLSAPSGASHAYDWNDVSSCSPEQLEPLRSDSVIRSGRDGKRDALAEANRQCADAQSQSAYQASCETACSQMGALEWRCTWTLQGKKALKGPKLLSKLTTQKKQVLSKAELEKYGRREVGWYDCFDLDSLRLADGRMAISSCRTLNIVSSDGTFSKPVFWNQWNTGKHPEYSTLLKIFETKNGEILLLTGEYSGEADSNNTMLFYPAVYRLSRNGEFLGSFDFRAHPHFKRAWWGASEIIYSSAHDALILTAIDKANGEREFKGFEVYDLTGKLAETVVPAGDTWVSNVFPGPNPDEVTFIGKKSWSSVPYIYTAKPGQGIVHRTRMLGVPDGEELPWSLHFAGRPTSNGLWIFMRHMEIKKDRMLLISADHQNKLAKFASPLTQRSNTGFAGRDAVATEGPFLTFNPDGSIARALFSSVDYRMPPSVLDFYAGGKLTARQTLPGACYFNDVTTTSQGMILAKSWKKKSEDGRESMGYLSVYDETGGFGMSEPLAVASSYMVNSSPEYKDTTQLIASGPQSAGFVQTKWMTKPTPNGGVEYVDLEYFWHDFVVERSGCRYELLPKQ